VVEYIFMSRVSLLKRAFFTDAGSLGRITAGAVSYLMYGGVDTKRTRVLRKNPVTRYPDKSPERTHVKEKHIGTLLTAFIFEKRPYSKEKTG
jgi:hypothetical protein